MKFRWGFSIFILLVGITSFFLWTPKKSQNHIIVSVVQKTFYQQVDVKGKLVALKSMSISSGLRGFPEIVKLAPEGKVVKKGDIVIQFNEEAFNHEKRQAELQLRLREAEKEEAEAKKIADLDKIDLQIERYKTDVEIAKLRLRDLRCQPRPNDLKISLLQYQQSKVVMDMAQQEFQRLSKDIHQGLVANTDLQKFEMDLQRSIANYRKERLNYKLTASGVLPYEIEKVELEKQRTMLQLKEALQERPKRVRQLQRIVDQASLRLEATKSELEKVKEKLSKSKVRSPWTGLIVYRQIWGRKVAVGGRYWRGLPLLDLPNLSVMELRGKILEKEIDLVKIKQKVKIFVDAFPNKVFHGFVRKIGKVAIDRSEKDTVGFLDQKKSTGIKVFEVFIQFEKVSEMLLPNMTARAQIQISKKKNVLVLPKIAVYRNKNKSFVYAANMDGKPQWKEVKAGVGNEYEIVILEGLKEKDSVIIGVGKK